MQVEKFSIHVCISGFTQTEKREHGVYRLAEQLMIDHSCGIFHRVWLRTWKDNWSDVAEHIWLLRERYRTNAFKVNIYGYSWGAGWGSVQLAKEMRRRGVSVNCLVLSDPVYRHPNLLFRWMALVGRDWWFAPRINIPQNVGEVHSFHQRQNRPQGHRLRCLSDSTIHHPAIEIVSEHEYMDDAKSWHQCCLDEARMIFDD